MWVDADITRLVRHSGRRPLLPEVIYDGDAVKVDVPVDVVRRSLPLVGLDALEDSRYHFNNDDDGASYRADQSRLAWAIIIHDVG